MKRCPKCNEVYSEQLRYCLIDGEALIEITEEDGEIPTVVRPKPIVVDLDDRADADDAPIISERPPAEKEPAIWSTARVLAILIAGGVIGGMLVLAASLVANMMHSDQVTGQGNRPANTIRAATPNISNAKTEPIVNRGVAAANAEGPGNTKTLENDDTSMDRDNSNSDPKDWKQLLRKGFNGRVIMTNAIVRSLPSVESDEVEILPYDEPIKIGKPAGDNNPWFRVTTFDGATGWMHGNTIEFVK